MTVSSVEYIMVFDYTKGCKVPAKITNLPQPDGKIKMLLKYL